MTMAPWMYSTSLDQLRYLYVMVRRKSVGPQIDISGLLLGVVYCGFLAISPQGFAAYDLLWERFLLSR